MIKHIFSKEKNGKENGDSFKKVISTLEFLILKVCLDTAEVFTGAQASPVILLLLPHNLFVHVASL